MITRRKYESETIYPLKSVANARKLGGYLTSEDRTGLAAMLLLSLLGVEESVIMEDYILTNEYNAGRIEGTKKYLRAKGCDDALTEKAALVFDAVDRSFMENAIAFLKEKYGSVVGYIHSELNISDGDIQLLKEKYTEYRH